ncbi:hypothetical protein YPPY54_1362, partial [Yersinia pestis PY-54]
MLCSVISS